MTAARKWGTAIIGLLLGNVAAMVLLATVANVGHSEVIPDYYTKAAHYDDTLAEQSASRALGWQVTATLVGGEAGVTVRDATGAPVRDAHVTIAGYPRAHASTHVSASLVGTGDGQYRGPADHVAGTHDLTITVERGTARFVSALVVEAR